MGFAYQKSGFNVDESLSVAISTGSWIPQLENGEYFGKGDFAWIKSRGIGLNLVFFTLGFYATFILMTKIFSRHSLLVPLFLAFAFCNSAGVTNSIFMRPYALQEMLLLIFTLNCFVFYRLQFASAKDAFKAHKFFFAWFIFATALLCLSHYFSLFFIAFAFVFLAIISRKNIFPLNVVMICSLVIAQVLYLGYFSSLFDSYRAKESVEKLLLLGNFWQNLNLTFGIGADIIIEHFYNLYGFVIICVAFGIAIYFRRDFIAESRQNFIFLFGFFIIDVVWFWLIFFVAPYKDLRYVMSIFPFLYFGVLLLLSFIKKHFTGSGIL